MRFLSTLWTWGPKGIQGMRAGQRTEPRQEPRQGAQAIRRALAVLRILAAGRETGLPLAEVVQATGLTRPTVHRIVHALIEEGIIERSEKTGRYAIGNQVPELALARPSRSALLGAADDVMRLTSRRVGDTLFLTVRTGNDTLCVDRRIGSYPIQVLSIEIGARRPLGVSSAGVAILAALPAQEARKIVAANEARFLPYRTSTSTVLAQITAARRRGYNMREVGLVQGTKSLSAWIKTADGRPAAAITASAVRSRLGPRREAEVAEILLKAAREIERELRSIS
jgi:DNA-binding IclR family transcriptional regulator